MSIENLTPFLIRIGSATAEPLPSAGAPRVIGGSAKPYPSVQVGPLSIRVDGHAAPERIEGLPVYRGEADIIVPLVVASAMRELGKTWYGRVYTPAMLVEEGGVKYAPHLILHADLSDPRTSDRTQPPEDYVGE